MSSWGLFVFVCRVRDIQAPTRRKRGSARIRARKERVSSRGLGTRGNPPPPVRVGRVAVRPVRPVRGVWGGSVRRGGGWRFARGGTTLRLGRRSCPCGVHGCPRLCLFVCLWWVAERAERFSRSSPALSYFALRSTACGKRARARVLARQLKRPSVTEKQVQRRFTFILSLSLSTLTSLGSARPETLSPFPLSPAALREAKAGFSLTQLTSPSAPPITVPKKK